MCQPPPPVPNAEILTEDDEFEISVEEAKDIKADAELKATWDRLKTMEECFEVKEFLVREGLE